MESKANRKARAAAIVAELERSYPDARCSLNFRSPFELLTATILSAQCTDERVNMVTPALFKRYPNPQAMAKSDPAELEEIIRTTGFFRNKTKSLKGMSQAVTEDHGGKVPATMDELRKLPGVGRKTANVVLGNCFGVPGLTIDTHMQRVNQRLGLTRETDPEKIERELMDLIPQPKWTTYSHQIIQHGRAICIARRPLCERCPLTQWCDYFQKYQKAAAEGAALQRSAARAASKSAKSPASPPPIASPRKREAK